MAHSLSLSGLSMSLSSCAHTGYHPHNTHTYKMVSVAQMIHRHKNGVYWPRSQAQRGTRLGAGNEARRIQESVAAHCKVVEMKS